MRRNRTKRGAPKKTAKGSDGNVFVVILGGGEGKRLWPASRRDHPKQFLALGSDRSLLQQTVERALLWVDPERIIITTNERFKRLVKTQLKRYRIPPNNFFWEPLPRNTAMAIGWVACSLQSSDPDAVMAVWPSDHHISRPASFIRACRRAVSVAP